VNLQDVRNWLMRRRIYDGMTIQISLEEADELLALLEGQLMDEARVEQVRELKTPRPPLVEEVGAGERALEVIYRQLGENINALHDVHNILVSALMYLVGEDVAAEMVEDVDQRMSGELCPTPTPASPPTGIIGMIQISVASSNDLAIRIIRLADKVAHTC